MDSINIDIEQQMELFITFFVECVNGEILQEPNNVGALNESVVRLDDHIPVAEAILIIWHLIIYI